MILRCLVSSAAFGIALGSPVAGRAESHAYDPCAVVSKTDVASAFGVATDQVFAPASANKNECAWAVAAHTGVPGQQAAFSLQTIDQAQHASGWQLMSSLAVAPRRIPGVPVTNAAVNQLFDNAQTVADLGDRASWKARTLSVVKKDVLLQVKVTANGADGQDLAIAKSIARSALNHMPDQ